MIRRTVLTTAAAVAGLSLLTASQAAAAIDQQQCMARQHVRCYAPPQVQHAYGVDRLHRSGLDGRGTRIAIIMSPVAGVRESVAMQSKRYGLPPARLSIVRIGNPGRPESGQAAVEGTLDVQATHLMAPRAHLLFMAVPSAAVNGDVLQDALVSKAVDTAVHKHADVISMSFGGVEQRYPQTRAAIARAVRAGVPVLAGSGDTGVTLPGLPGQGTSYPATDPNVTAVGGTLLTLDGRGNRLLPDVAWGPDVAGGASGGGLSQLSALPSWQRGYAGVIGTKRNYPDISMLAAASGSLIVAFSKPSKLTGFKPVSGTSVATPLLAGVLALARQHGGHPLRSVNHALYRLAAHNARRNGIVDVVLGNNSYVANGAGVPGYLATTGYDRVTGLGTIDGPRFVRAIAGATR